MAGDVFGERLDRRIAPVLEGLEEMDAPGVVHQHPGATAIGAMPICARPGA